LERSPRLEGTHLALRALTSLSRHSPRAIARGEFQQTDLSAPVTPESSWQAGPVNDAGADPHAAAPVTTEPVEGRPATRPARYAVGMFGTSIPINLVKGSMILFYVDLLGLDVRLYGIVMFAYAIIDAVDNPVL